jgi:hypothetical protein
MDSECIVCYEKMTTWNMNTMSCSHSICLECSDKIQSTCMRITMPPVSFSGGYIVKYHVNGYKMKRVSHFILQGYKNTMKCPYCRQCGPTLYDFDEIRFSSPLFTTEWNILERKLYQSKLQSFTMSRDGNTFAFKLSKNSLHVMWSESNTYAYTLPLVAYKMSKDRSSLLIGWTEFNKREIRRREFNRRSKSSPCNLVSRGRC